MLWELKYVCFVKYKMVFVALHKPHGIIGDHMRTLHGRLFFHVTALSWIMNHLKVSILNHGLTVVFTMPNHSRCTVYFKKWICWMWSWENITLCGKEQFYKICCIVFWRENSFVYFVHLKIFEWLLCSVQWEENWWKASAFVELIWGSRINKINK